MRDASLSRPIFMVVAGLAAPGFAAVVGLMLSRYGSPLHLAGWFVLAAALAAGGGVYLRRPAGEIVVGAVFASVVEALALFLIFIEVRGLS